MRSFEFSCIWRESKGLWKCILWNNLCLRQLSKMLCIMFCSFWGTVGSTLMNATSSRAHTVQIIEFKARHLKLPADLTWGIEHSLVWTGANLLHTWFTLFCWSNDGYKAVTNGSATVSMINLATWQNGKTAAVSGKSSFLRRGFEKHWYCRKFWLSGCHVGWEIAGRLGRPPASWVTSHC